MRESIITYCTENKIAISFESPVEYCALCDYFGIINETSLWCGIVSFYIVKVPGNSNVFSRYRSSAISCDYWSKTGYEIISAVDFFDLCDETKSILTFVK